MKAAKNLRKKTSVESICQMSVGEVCATFKNINGSNELEITRYNGEVQNVYHKAFHLVKCCCDDL